MALQVVKHFDKGDLQAKAAHAKSPKSNLIFLDKR
jgi:hypothetical protein